MEHDAYCFGKVCRTKSVCRRLGKYAEIGSYKVMMIILRRLLHNHLGVMKGFLFWQLIELMRVTVLYGIPGPMVGSIDNVYRGEIRRYKAITKYIS